MSDQPTTPSPAEATPEPEQLEAAAVRRSDAGNWAKVSPTLHLENVPEGAINLNVEGRRTASPMQGFGKMWQKTYSVRIPSSIASPTDVVTQWRAAFSSFWPPGNFFYSPFTDLSPGDVALLNLKAVGRVKLSTGMLVMYVDDEAITLMTPVGHFFAAFNTFGAHSDGDDTIVQIQPLFRSGDPIYEMGMPIMSRMEDRFWAQTLRNVAAHFGVEDVEVTQTKVCIDKKRNWAAVKNVRHNSLIRSILYLVATPFRWIARPFKKDADPDAQAPDR
ncbi:MAG: hypothetical protein GEU78_02220 [Actinobacteria bacterium]|nr:hypothetical protein [Actinomycetota bacterium]